MFLITGRGWYLTRSNQKVWVRDNEIGWLDGLPFAVSKEQGGTFAYTVNKRGLLYPDDHRVYQDTQGYWQPDFFRECRYTCSQDLMERIS